MIIIYSIDFSYNVAGTALGLTAELDHKKLHPRPQEFMVGLG
jgi:hypothetical protein